VFEPTFGEQARGRTDDAKGDVVGGHDGPDAVGGKRGSHGGDKNLSGGPGNDGVEGGKGSDNIVGGRGNDWLFEGAEPDVAKIDNISAGAGNDAIWVLNWSPVGKDILSCGDGFDRVLADGTDVIADDCERVFFGRRNIDAFFEDIPNSFWEGLPPGP
jgi:Ca2+-binding RTX toxin-like protein